MLPPSLFEVVGECIPTITNDVPELMSVALFVGMTKAFKKVDRKELLGMLRGYSLGHAHKTNFFIVRAIANVVRPTLYELMDVLTWGDYWSKPPTICPHMWVGDVIKESRIDLSLITTGCTVETLIVLCKGNVNTIKFIFKTEESRMHFYPMVLNVEHVIDELNKHAEGNIMDTVNHVVQYIPPEKAMLMLNRCCQYVAPLEVFKVMHTSLYFDEIVEVTLLLQKQGSCLLGSLHVHDMIKVLELCSDVEEGLLACSYLEGEESLDEMKKVVDVVVGLSGCVTRRMVMMCLTVSVPSFVLLSVYERKRLPSDDVVSLKDMMMKCVNTCVDRSARKGDGALYFAEKIAERGETHMVTEKNLDRVFQKLDPMDASGVCELLGHNTNNEH